MLIRRLRSLVLVALVLPATPEQLSAQEIPYVRLVESATDFALDPQTGNLAAVEPEKNKVVLYGADLSRDAPAKPIASAETFIGPGTILYKRTPSGGVFIVGGRDKSSIQVFEPATLKRLKSFDVEGTKILCLASSTDPADPHVYYSTGMIGRINIETGFDTGKLYDEGAVELAISARGSYLYRHNNGSPTGFESVSIKEPTDPAQKPVLTRHIYEHHDCPGYLPDPAEQYVFVNRQAWSAGLETKVADLKFAPLCFFADRAVVAGIEAEDARRSGDPYKQVWKIVVGSYNSLTPSDAKPVAEGFVPIWQNGVRHENTGGLFTFNRDRRTRMFADDGRKRIVLAHADHVIAVPLSDFQIKDEPYLIVDADTRRPILVGRKNTIPLKPRDSNSKLELVDKPEGAVLTPAGLEWTPGESSLGKHVVKLRVSNGAAERTQTLELTVERTGMALPFTPNKVAIADDGRSAFIWSTPGLDTWGRPQTSRLSARGAVLDLTEEKVVADAPLSLTAHIAAVDALHVYVAQADAGLLAVLDRANLSLKKNLTLPGPVMWIKSLDGKVLLVGFNDGRRIRYSLPDLAEISAPPAAVPAATASGGMPNRNGIVAFPAPQPVAGGWKLPSGDIVDSQFEKPRLVVAPRNILPCFSYFDRDDDAPPVPFRRTTDGRESIDLAAHLTDSAKGIVATLSRISKQVQIPGSDFGYMQVETWLVDFFDPATRAFPPRQTIELSKESIRNGRTNRTIGGFAALIVSGDRLLAFTPARMYSLPLPAPAGAGATAFAFEPRQSAVTLDAGEVVALKHALAGGKPPYQFGLEAMIPGMAVDAATGEVTLIGPMIAAAVLDLQVGPANRSSAQRGRPLATAEAVDAYLKRATDPFQEVVGRGPKGVPLRLDIRLRATDAEGKAARLRYALLVELPRAAVDQRIAQVAALAAAPPAGDVNVEAELQQLEQRLGGLESRLDRIAKLLEIINNKNK